MIYVNLIHKQTIIVKVHMNRGLLFLAFTVYLVIIMIFVVTSFLTSLVYFKVPRRESECVREISEKSAGREN